MTCEKRQSDPDLRDRTCQWSKPWKVIKDIAHWSKWCSAVFLGRQHENCEHERAGDEHLDEDALRAVNSLCQESAVGASEREERRWGRRGGVVWSTRTR